MISNLAQGIQAFTSNVFLVDGARSCLVDPGANFDVVDAIRRTHDHLDAVVLTHTHRDHIGNLPAVRKAFDVAVWGFEPSADGVDHELVDEETITLGDSSYEIRHTPGHKDDHICLYSAEAGVLIAGDLVFANGGFGRTDLPEGNREVLIDSIDSVLEWVDPDLEEMHCGHGPSVQQPYEHIELAARMARQL